MRYALTNFTPFLLKCFAAFLGRRRWVQFNPANRAILGCKLPWERTRSDDDDTVRRVLYVVGCTV
jgi:hypothetical protein